MLDLIFMEYQAIFDTNIFTRLPILNSTFRDKRKYDRLKILKLPRLQKAELLILKYNLLHTTLVEKYFSTTVEYFKSLSIISNEMVYKCVETTFSHG